MKVKDSIREKFENEYLGTTVDDGEGEHFVVKYISVNDSHDGMEIMFYSEPPSIDAVDLKGLYMTIWSEMPKKYAPVVE